MKPPHEPNTQAQPEKSKREQTETKDATRDGKGPAACLRRSATASVTLIPPVRLSRRDQDWLPTASQGRLRQDEASPVVLSFKERESIVVLFYYRRSPSLKIALTRQFREKEFVVIRFWNDPLRKTVNQPKAATEYHEC